MKRITNNKENKIKEFKEYLINIKCYSQKTFLTYKPYIETFIANDLDYICLMNNNYKNTSANTKRIILSAIKCYLKYIKDERYKEIELPKKEEKVTNYITYEEYQKMLYYLEANSNKNIKKILIIKLLFETGLRSYEILNIKKENIDNEKIRIFGKGKKERLVFFSNSLNSYFQEFLNNIKDNDHLFNFEYKNLYKLIKELGKKTIGKNISPHMFRRGFATHCINLNIGIYEISIMMGHKNINTTRGYIRSESKIELMKHIFN